MSLLYRPSKDQVGMKRLALELCLLPDVLQWPLANGIRYQV
jgi:hypothetical protein